LILTLHNQQLKAASARKLRTTRRHYQEMLKAMQRAERSMQPVSLAIGVEPSPQGRAVIPRMIQRAEAVLQSWGVWHPPEPENGTWF